MKKNSVLSLLAVTILVLLAISTACAASKAETRQDGRVVEVLQNDFYKVRLDRGNVVTATPSAQLRRGRVKIRLGDHVAVEMSGRTATIVMRYK